MIDLEKLNLNAVLRYYMLANTPRYLYRHLREEPSLASLAESSTPRELLDEITARETSGQTVEDFAIAYALLVALSFQNYGAVVAVLADWQPIKLAWGKSIAAILAQSAIVTTAARLDARSGRIVTTSEQDTTPVEFQGFP